MSNSSVTLTWTMKYVRFWFFLGLINIINSARIILFEFQSDWGVWFIGHPVRSISTLHSHPGVICTLYLVCLWDYLRCYSVLGLGQNSTDSRNSWECSYLEDKNPTRNIQQDRQCTYNVTMRSGRTTIVAVEGISIAYSECVFVALVIQHAMRMRHIVTCGKSRYTIFFHIISRFSNKRYWTQNVCFDFLYKSCPKHFSF
jgi:hypothetical protein